MAFSKPKPEKAPGKTEELKKLPTKKKKCLACNDGLVYDGKRYRACKGCKGQGFIV